MVWSASYRSRVWRGGFVPVQTAPYGDLMRGVANIGALWEAFT